MIKKYRLHLLLFLLGITCGLIIHSAMERKAKNILSEMIYENYIINIRDTSEKIAAPGNELEEIHYLYNSILDKEEFISTNFNELFYTDSFFILCHQKQWDERTMLLPEKQLVYNAGQNAKIALLLDKLGMHEEAQKEWDKSMAIIPSQNDKVMNLIRYSCKYYRTWPKDLLDSELTSLNSTEELAAKK